MNTCIVTSTVTSYKHNNCNIVNYLDFLFLQQMLSLLWLLCYKSTIAIVFKVVASYLYTMTTHANMNNSTTNGLIIHGNVLNNCQ